MGRFEPPPIVKPAADLAALARQIAKKNEVFERADEASEQGCLKANEAARDLGLVLKQAKDQCVRERLEWLEWLEQKTNVSNQRASEAVRIADNWSVLFPHCGNMRPGRLVKKIPSANAKAPTAKESPAPDDSPPDDSPPDLISELGPVLQSLNAIADRLIADDLRRMIGLLRAATTDLERSLKLRETTP